MSFLTGLTIAIACLQTASAQQPPDPVTDPAAYSVYSTFLPGWKHNFAGDLLVLQLETEPENHEACGALLDELTGEWAEAARSLRLENSRQRVLQAAALAGDGTEVRLVARAEIVAHEAPLLADTSQPYPRPGALEHMTVSAVGFNGTKNMALVYVRRRLVNDQSEALAMWELKDGKWTLIPKSCGGGHLR